MITIDQSGCTIFGSTVFLSCADRFKSNLSSSLSRKSEKMLLHSTGKTYEIRSGLEKRYGDSIKVILKDNDDYLKKLDRNNA